ncbi:MAG: D-2-hydroxyacid dehydrogenase [bacterium]|nr:D-2-hydroxyacid dehydrogenase [bacterium]
MQTVEVLVMQPVSDDDLNEIAAVDPSIRVVDARGLFDIEIRDTWPQWTVQRYLRSGPLPESTREQRDLFLSNAEVIFGGWPFVLDLCARAPHLKWFHQRPAGASNLLRGDLWNSKVTVTTSRGYGNTLPMAEYVLGSFFHFDRAFHMAYRDQQRHQFDHRTYRPVSLPGKTVCVVGAGGIGLDVGRLCAEVGMHVVGTRRTPVGADLPPGFSRLETPDHLYDLLSESEFVAICCQWTPATTNLIGRQAFAAMQSGTVLVNVARGEIIDQAALLEALASGLLRGVALDVYVGEFEHEPDHRLWDDERVLITPHVSGGAEKQQHRGIELFCKNLRAYLNGQPLTNVIDWQRGY